MLVVGGGEMGGGEKPHLVRGRWGAAETLGTEEDRAGVLLVGLWRGGGTGFSAPSFP